MDLTNEPVEHPVFGTGRVINQDDHRIIIQFSEKIGVKRFLYPDVFEKYLNMCNPAASQKVRADLTAKRAQIEEQQLKEEETAQEEIKILALAAKKRKSTPKTKQTKAKTEDDSSTTEIDEVNDG